MRKVLLTAMILASMTSLCNAEDYKPEPWQEKAAKTLPKIFGKIKEVHWPQNGSLWLAVRRDNTNWEAASHLICKALDGAGRPAKDITIISFLDADRLDGFNRIAKAHCDSRKDVSMPTTDEEPEDLGVMNADGTISKE
jgi:hypothetical protein